MIEFYTTAVYFGFLPMERVPAFYVDEVARRVEEKRRQDEQQQTGE
ncbi:hypothetical protein [Bhargavaea ginsengi]